METIYRNVSLHMQRVLGREIPKAILKRFTLLVLGILKSKSTSPAQMAKALQSVGLGNAASIERQLRRIENDERLDTRYFHPLARLHLGRCDGGMLHLCLDPTTKQDQVVLVTISVQYRGRCLPLVWTHWPANCPLEGERFWERIGQLLKELADLIPSKRAVLITADRAFGTPVFTDLVRALGWHYLVRVQDQTRCRDPLGRECCVRALKPGKKRAKMRGQVFKKQGWREATVVVYRSPDQKQPMCVVSDLPPRWELLRWYQYRAVIETLFRHYKSRGWHLEQSQVCDRTHLERLLIGLAWATWITVGLGRLAADQLLQTAPLGRRRTRPWWAKDSLFEIGLQQIEMIFFHEAIGAACRQLFKAATSTWSGWGALAWGQQVRNLIGRAYVMALQ